jgi:threonine dehydrogenase-like Zn-dependent dehydrogenase
MPHLPGDRYRRVPEDQSRSRRGAYGYVDMGGWIGGQARYVIVPYADFNLLKFPAKNRAMSKIIWRAGAMRACGIIAP